MQFGVTCGRAVFLHDGRWLDVHGASEGRFGHEAEDVFCRWDQFRHWAQHLDPQGSENEVQPTSWDPPSPKPRQVVGIGANYADHATEMKLTETEPLVVFAKFATSLVGDGSTVVLPTRSIDWEVELVVVIGQRAWQVSSAEAWSYVAGLTVGQDLTDRKLQLDTPGRQFSLSKSFPGAGPVGPVLVTPDEFDNPDDLAIGCSFAGETMQSSRTSCMLRPVSSIISELSAHMELLPGDLVFTGSPSGAGHARKPARYLEAGQLVSWVEGVGMLSVTLV